QCERPQATWNSRRHRDFPSACRPQRVIAPPEVASTSRKCGSKLNLWNADSPARRQIPWPSISDHKSLAHLVQRVRSGECIYRITLCQPRFDMDILATQLAVAGAA